MNKNSFKYIAHRGLHSKELNILENTLEAFKRAMDNNYAIELDVQITKDNKVVVFHDYNLERMTEKNIYVKDITLNELKKITLKGSFSTVPTLEEVLSLINGKVPLLIEIKNEGKVSILEEKLIEILSNYNGEFMLESFNPFVVSYFKENTNFLCGILVCKIYDSIKGKIVGMLFNILLLLNILKTDFIAYKYKDLDESVVKKIVKRNIPLYVWTIDNDNDLDSANKFSQGIIFENVMPK